MIGMIGAIGSPLWPWQALQVCKLSSSSSRAVAGRTRTARIVTAPAMVEMRILDMCCTAPREWSCVREDRDATKRMETDRTHAADRQAAQALISRSQGRLRGHYSP